MSMSKKVGKALEIGTGAIIAIFIYWGLWKLLVWLYTLISSDDFWIQRLFIMFFAVITAVITLFVTQKMRDEIEKNRLVIYLDVLAIEVGNHSKQKLRFPSALEIQDLKPLIKYVSPNDYTETIRIVNVLNSLSSESNDKIETLAEDIGFFESANRQIEKTKSRLKKGLNKSIKKDAEKRAPS